MNWIEHTLHDLGIVKRRRKPRAPNKHPSELTEGEKAYRAVRAARARAKRRAKKSA